MRIWIFNHYATSPSVPGGSRHYSLAKNLVNSGHEVIVFAASFHYNNYVETQEYSDEKSWKEEYIDGVRFIWFKTFPYQENSWKRYVNIIDYSLKIRNFNYNLFEKPDVIIGSSFHLFAPWIAKGIAKKYNVPFVSEIRDFWPETLRALGGKPYHPLILLMSYMEKVIYKASSRIIVLFPKAHEYILQLNLGIPRKQIVRISNGVDCKSITGEYIPLPSSGELDFMQRADKTLKVLNAGSLGNVYCLDQLLEAMKILQDKQAAVHLYLVGNGVKEKELKEQAKELNLKNVSFHAPISKKLIPSLLANADVLYASVMDSPLYKWGMSLNKIHEYLAAAKPIVFGYNQRENPVEESKCGFTIPPNNPKVIAETFLKLMNMTEEERMDLGKRGRECAENEYDFIQLSKKLEMILEESVKEYKNQ